MYFFDCMNLSHWFRAPNVPCGTVYVIINTLLLSVAASEHMIDVCKLLDLRFIHFGDLHTFYFKSIVQLLYSSFFKCLLVQKVVLPLKLCSEPI